MVNGRKSRTARGARASVVAQRSTPWGMIAAVLVVLLFAGGVFGFYVVRNNDRQERADALAAFTPTADNQDPAKAIPGIELVGYAGGQHVRAEQKVAYTHSPAFGGTHDANWAACNGVVYPDPVRTENLVHSLEHGAVWIAYDPARVSGDALATLRAKVDGRPYTVMSPFPGLDQPIALQSWGHQLKLADAGDVRVDQFISALRRNQFTHPEVGASCQALGPGQFDQDAPPPFAAAPPVSAVDNATVFPEVGAGPGGVMPDPAR